MRGTITDIVKGTDPNKLPAEKQAATPKLLEAMNQAKIAKQNGDMLGVKAAGRDAVNELGVQTHKSNQTQANAINKAEAQLNDAYLMYYNMLSTQQLDKLYENMKTGHEAGDVPLEQLTRIEGVLAQKPDSKYNQVYRGGLQNMPKTIGRLLPDSWTARNEDKEPIPEPESFDNPLMQAGAHVLQVTQNAGESLKKGLTEFPAFVAMMLGDTDQDPNEFKSGFAVLMEGTVPPKHMAIAMDIMNQYWQLYGEDAVNHENYQIARAWYDSIASKWESSVTKALREHYEQNYSSWEVFGNTLYNDPFTIVSDAAGVLAPALHATKVPSLMKAARLLDIVDPESAMFNIAEAVTIMRRYQSSLVDSSAVTSPQQAFREDLTMPASMRWAGSTPPNELTPNESVVVALNPSNDMFSRGLFLGTESDGRISVQFMMGSNVVTQQVDSVYHGNRQWQTAGTPSGWATQDPSLNIGAILENVYDTGESFTHRDAMSHAVVAWRELGHEGIPMLENLRVGTRVSFWNPMERQATWGTYLGHGGMGNRYLVEHNGVRFETELITMGDPNNPMSELQAYTYDPELQMSMRSETGQGFQHRTTMSVESVADWLQDRNPDDFVSDPDVSFSRDEVMDMLDESDNQFLQELADDDDFVAELTESLNDRLIEHQIDNPPNILDGNSIGELADSVIETLTADQIADGSVEVSEIWDALESMYFQDTLSDYDMNWLANAVNERIDGMSQSNAEMFGVDIDMQDLTQAIFDNIGEDLIDVLDSAEDFEDRIGEFVRSRVSFDPNDLTNQGWQAIFDGVRELAERGGQRPSTSTTRPDVDPNEIRTASDLLEALGESIDTPPTRTAQDFTFGSDFLTLLDAYNRITDRVYQSVRDGNFPDRFPEGQNPSPHPDFPVFDKDMVNLYKDYAKVAELSDNQINDFLQDPNLTHPRLLGEVVNMKERVAERRTGTGSEREDVGGSGQGSGDTEGLTPHQTEGGTAYTVTATLEEQMTGNVQTRSGYENATVNYSMSVESPFEGVKSWVIELDNGEWGVAWQRGDSGIGIDVPHESRVMAIEAIFNADEAAVDELIGQAPPPVTSGGTGGQGGGASPQGAATQSLDQLHAIADEISPDVYEQILDSTTAESGQTTVGRENLISILDGLGHNPQAMTPGQLQSITYRVRSLRDNAQYSQAQQNYDQGLGSGGQTGTPTSGSFGYYPTGVSRTLADEQATVFEQLADAVEDAAPDHPTTDARTNDLYEQWQTINEEVNESLGIDSNTVLSVTAAEDFEMPVGELMDEVLMGGIDFDSMFDVTLTFPDGRQMLLYEFAESQGWRRVHSSSPYWSQHHPDESGQVGVTVDIGSATPYEVAQEVLSANRILQNDPNLTRGQLAERVDEILANNEWESRSVQVGFSDQVMDIIDRMRTGVAVENTPLDTMNPMQRGQALYPTPPALRNEEWLGEPESAFWRVRDLEPEPDFLERPPANPRNLSNIIDNRFADMRLSQLDRQSLVNRVMTGADAEQSSFVESNLSRVDADHVNFNVSLMNRVVFHDANIEFSTFQKSRMSNANFARSRITEADFTDAKLNNANFSEAMWHNYNPNGYVREGYISVKFDYANLTNANFRNAEIDHASFNGAAPVKADFRDAVLNNANFDSTMSGGANFTGADLTDATFRNASLNRAKFNDAELTGVDFTDANIEAADFTGSNWQDAILTDQQRQYLELRYGDIEDL